MSDSLIPQPQKAGDFIPVKQVTGSPGVQPHTSLSNLVSGAGMNGLISQADTHDNDGAGATMWLAAGAGHPNCKEDERPYVIFDFGATYPVGEMHVWNYNQLHPYYVGLARRGLKNVIIEYSVNGYDWRELKGSGYPYRFACADGSAALAATNLDDGKASPVPFNNVLARFVKITAAGGVNVGNWGGYEGKEGYYGLSAVRFYAGSGYASVPDAEWTQLLHQQSGWSGADGFYSAPFDGNEAPGSGKGQKSIFVFGDSFISEVDKATDNRLKQVMVNNTTAILTGDRPDRGKIVFQWQRDEKGRPRSAFVPTTKKATGIPDTYYWLQDGVSINGKFYCFPMIIGPDPGGMEGFEFQLYGITRISAPIDPERGILFDQQEQIDTDLHFTANNGKLTYFGAAIMPHTEAAGAPGADGCIYIYGLQEGKPVVARVKSERFEDLEQWTFWNGSEWTPAKEETVPIAEETSAEYSVSPMTFGPHKGKYVMTYQTGGISGNHVCLAFADRPQGPFAGAFPIHYCQEPEEGKRIYTYNAKAHPHLSTADSLLVTYNVNTTSWKAHELYASIYRPRFIRIQYFE